MEISKRQANEIIVTLKSVIKEDINFISPLGEIIASSNQDRVGSFHEGATIVAQTNKLLIINNDNTYEGTKKGINLPVYFEKNLLAIIGITGKYEEIMQFSTIIVKMSEILIKEQFLNTQKQFKRENNRIIMELITKDKVQVEELIRKMKELGYNADEFNCFAICELDHFDATDIDLANMIYNSIEKRIHYKDLVARFQNKFLILSQQKSDDKFRKNIDYIKGYVENKYKIGIMVGLSQKIKSAKDINTAYKQANMVVEISFNKGSRTTKEFDPTSLEFLFFGVSDYITKSFSKHVLDKYDEKEKVKVKEMILAYIKNNGSISKTSSDLFIHKNTLQYRLNKVAKMTGYNPRELKSLIVLYLALELMDIETKKKLS